MRQKRKTFRITRINKVNETPEMTMGITRTFKVKAKNKKQAEEIVDSLNAKWLAGKIEMPIYDIPIIHVRTGMQRTYSIMADSQENAQMAASELHELYKEAHGI